MTMDFEELEQKVITWAYARGILPDDQENAARTKLLKIIEEIGELAHAELRHDETETIDAIGDVFVTLIIFAQLKGLSVVKCLQEALVVISKRTGRVINGTFIREK